MNKLRIFLLLITFTLINFVLFGCRTITGSQQTNMYNVPELESYANFVNKLAVENGMSAFLWDCSTYMDRNALKNQYPTCTKKMIEAYNWNGTKGNGKNNCIFEEEDAFTAVKNFAAGWNLGNTLDSTSFNIENAEKNELGWIQKWPKRDKDGNAMPISWETAWGEPATTQEIAEFVLNEGFNAIRIPITWAEHFDEKDNIDSLWMDRVVETVNYFYTHGVYCIINVHHDGGADGWIEATETSYEKYSERFKKLWQQISQTFKDYDERLLFESMNEVLDGSNNWSANENGCKWINKWNQLFVDTVRSTGGNNSNRNLVVMTYAGEGSETALKYFELPQDSVFNHLIVEIHNYNPHGFTWANATWTKMTALWSENCESVLKNDFAIYKKYSDKWKVPFIVGEYCATPKKYVEYD